MTKSTAIARAIGYFESADLREAKAAFTIVREVMETRQGAINQATLPFVKIKMKPGRKPGVKTTPLQTVTTDANLKANSAAQKDIVEAETLGNA